MKAIIKTTINYLLSSILLISLSTGLFANSMDTIEVFLSADDELDTASIELAHDEGFTLIYYRITELEELSKAINENASRLLQPSIDTVKDKLDADYEALSDGERTRLVIKAYEKHKGDIQYLKNKLITPQIREKYKRALEDKQYANSHGIFIKDLPALMFNKTVYKNSLDLEKLIDESIKEPFKQGGSIK